MGQELMSWEIIRMWGQLYNNAASFKWTSFCQELISSILRKIEQKY